MVFDVLQDSLESLRSLVADFEPAGLDGVQAMQLVGEFAEIERLAAAGRTLAAGRVARDRRLDRRRCVSRRRELDGVRHRYDRRTRRRRRSRLRNDLVHCRRRRRALRSGALSDVQVDAVAKAAAADPNAERVLLACAGTEGVKGLKDHCARVEAAVSTDQAERYEFARAPIGTCATGRCPTSKACSSCEGRSSSPPA